MQRIHVTGGPSSGKSTLAKRIAATRGLPLYDLDDVTLRVEAAGKPFAAVADEALQIAEHDCWVTEGVYLSWAEPLLQRAGLIIWLRTSWSVASYRIVARHIRTTIAGTNRFPGWRRLYGFWRWSMKYYQDRNEPGIDKWGSPRTQETIAQVLAPYMQKVVICRNNREIAALLAQRFDG